MTLDEIKITLKSNNDSLLHIYLDVFDNSLSRKWLAALNHLLSNNYHLEKNYCWLGWDNHARSAEYICTQINRSIHAINSSDLDYHISDWFSPGNVIDRSLDIRQDRTNQLHKYFEDLQGWSGAISDHYTRATPELRWHIRQLNLLCHELESLVLSLRKAQEAPDWRRPSQLMCWLQAPRFELDYEDYELFGIETINRNLGGVYVGVNKAVGKHHWEVFWDEGRDSRLSELTTTALRGQTEAAGDFDIEWGRNPGEFDWQKQHLSNFQQWLAANGFDPEEKALTIGHPQVGQVDLQRSFGTQDHNGIWDQMATHLNVVKIASSTAEATYDYNWTDSDYAEQQQRILK